MQCQFLFRETHPVDSTTASKVKAGKSEAFASNNSNIHFVNFSMSPLKTCSRNSIMLSSLKVLHSSSWQCWVQHIKLNMAKSLNGSYILVFVVFQYISRMESSINSSLEILQFYFIFPSVFKWNVRVYCIIFLHAQIFILIWAY